MTRTKSARYLESCHNHHNHVSRQKRRKEKGGGGRFFKNKSKVRRYKRDGSEYQGKEAEVCCHQGREEISESKELDCLKPAVNAQSWQSETDE
jgi:hypothetical protein